jgi:ferredoxin-like protein FixX
MLTLLIKTNYDRDRKYSLNYVQAQMFLQGNTYKTQWENAAYIKYTDCLRFGTSIYVCHHSSLCVWAEILTRWEGRYDKNKYFE